MEAVLVTGANGFIGSRVVRNLVAHGHEVRAFVRPGSNLDALRPLPADRVKICVGDITCGHTVYRALAGCDALCHLAANYRLWAADPRSIREPSVVGTRAVLEAALARRLRRILITSSAQTLGSTPEPKALDESAHNHIADPDPYVSAKIEAERIALNYAERGLPIVVVNPGLVLGPGDWKPTPSGAAIVQFLNWPGYLKLPVPDRGGVSIVDVDDVANGHRLALKRGRIGERYILGGENVETAALLSAFLPSISGYGPRTKTIGRRSALAGARLMEALARVTGRPPMLTYRTARDALFDYFWLNSDKAKRELGYEFRPLGETLERSVRWYLSNGYVRTAIAQRAHARRAAS